MRCKYHNICTRPKENDECIFEKYTRCKDDCYQYYDFEKRQCKYRRQCIYKDVNSACLFEELKRTEDCPVYKEIANEEQKAE